jgi:hypothetical protein
VSASTSIPTRKVLLIYVLCVAIDCRSAAAHSFGLQPLNDVIAAATTDNNCASQLSTNKLVAMMLSVTWWEVTGADASEAPAPMTLSRWDTGWPGLFFNSDIATPYRRSFWHPGIGMWQLDDIGLGTDLSYGRFDTYYSSITVADFMSRRYCAVNGNVDMVFYPTWFACANGNCLTTFNRLYDAANISTQPERLIVSGEPRSGLALWVAGRAFSAISSIRVARRVTLGGRRTLMAMSIPMGQRH